VSTASLPAPIARPVPELARYSVAEVEVMADRVVRSRLFPGVDTPQAAFTLMMLCQSEGLHPMQALKRYHIIEGRPSMRADAMQAEFLARGGWIRWEQFDEEAAVATFGHRQHCVDGIRLAVSFQQLDRAGVTRGREGLKTNWKRFPGAMLRARLISMGVRMLDPAVIVGLYTPEEVADFDRPPEALESSEPAAPALPPPPAPAHPQNHSGHGRGQYASPDQIAEYRRRLGKVIDQANAAWLDGWANRNRGEVPAGIRDLTQIFEVDGHLLKWCVETGRLDPAIVPEEAQSRQLGAYVAIVYHRDPAALRAELARYLDTLQQRRTEAFLRKYPEWAGDPQPATEDETQEPPFLSDGGEREVWPDEEGEGAESDRAEGT
jgi:hypothetical protein